MVPVGLVVAAIGYLLSGWLRSRPSTGILIALLLASFVITLLGSFFQLATAATAALDLRAVRHTARRRVASFPHAGVAGRGGRGARRGDHALRPQRHREIERPDRAPDVRDKVAHDALVICGSDAASALTSGGGHGAFHVPPSRAVRILPLRRDLPRGALGALAARCSRPGLRRVCAALQPVQRPHLRAHLGHDRGCRALGLGMAHDAPRPDGSDARLAALADNGCSCPLVRMVRLGGVHRNRCPGAGDASERPGGRHRACHGPLG